MQGFEEEKITPVKGDLVICLDTGSVGIVLAERDFENYLVSYPHGDFVVHRDDFDVLKSGRRGEDHV